MVINDGKALSNIVSANASILTISKPGKKESVSKPVGLYTFCPPPPFPLAGTNPAECKPEGKQQKMKLVSS